MTRRFTIEHSESRSETIRTRLDLSLDDPPFRYDSAPTAHPNSRAAVQVLQRQGSATPSETEPEA